MIQSRPARRWSSTPSRRRLRFGHVAVARALVLKVLAGEAVEEADLAEHRPDAAIWNISHCTAS
jgi:hypothetical protein